MECVVKVKFSCGVLVSVLFSAMSAHAADGGEIMVKGYILPAACHINFSNSGAIDYGRIPSSDLHQDEPTDLPEKQAVFSIDCDSKARIGLNVTDEVSGTAMDGGVAGGNPDANAKYGLGLSGEHKIGAYTMYVEDVIADGESGFDMLSSTTTEGWVNNPQGSVVQGYNLSWGHNNSPVASKSVSGSVKVLAALNSLKELPVQEEVNINGLATFEIVYL